MRAVTFFGLMIIAKCIDSDRITEMATFVAITTCVLLILDLIEYVKNLSE